MCSKHQKSLQLVKLVAMFTSLMTKHESISLSQSSPPKTYQKKLQKPTEKTQQNTTSTAIYLPVSHLNKSPLRSTSKPSRCGSICNSSLGRKRCNTGPSISKDILSRRSPRAPGPQNRMPRDGQMSLPSRSSNLEWFVPRTRFRLDPAENVIESVMGLMGSNFFLLSYHQLNPRKLQLPRSDQTGRFVGADVHSDVPLQD